MNTLETVKEILVDMLFANPDEITETTTLEQLGADSLDHVEVTIAIESEFHISISDEEQFKDSTSVSEMVQLIERKKEAR